MSSTTACDREIDAALEVHRVQAGGHGLDAFAHDRLGQHGGGGGAVAGLGAGPGGDLAHHLGTHVLELVGKLDLLGHGHAVLGDARRAVALVEHDVAALGAERHLDRIGQGVDPVQHPVTGIDGKSHVLGSHVSISSLYARSGHRVDSITPSRSDFLHDQVVFIIDPDLGARPLAEQHPVTRPDIEPLDLAALVSGTRTDGDDLAFLRLLLGGVRNDDASGGLAFLLDAADHDAVVEWTELHRFSLARLVDAVGAISTPAPRVLTNSQAVPLSSLLLNPAHMSSTSTVPTLSEGWLLRPFVWKR